MIEQACLECGKTFEAAEHKIMFMGQERDLTDTICPKCCEDHAAQENVRRKAELDLARAAVRRRWREEWSGIPSFYQHKTFETFQESRQRTAYAAAEAYANTWDDQARGKPSIFMYSETYGVGKTHLMAAIGHRILDRWQGDPEYSVLPFRYAAERDLFNKLRATYNPEPSGPTVTEDMVYRRYLKAPLLLLDDMGKEAVKDPTFRQRVYWNLIDSRYQDELPIIISSNLSLDGVAQYVSSAIADRIVEMTRGNIIQMDGSSYRLDHAGEVKA